MAVTKGFQMLDDSLPDNHSLPAFMVSRTRGFLPRQEPLIELPAPFAPLESLLCVLPITRADGKPGLLAENKLGAFVNTQFPNLVEHIEEYEDNQYVLAALYRDYSFLASSYLLEPCHHEFLKSGGYGEARDVLPENVAMPIARVAELTGFKPFMEYAGSYALANYRLLEPSKGLGYDNMSPIRAFEHGLNRESSEAGFMLVHVDMVRHSGPLVAGAYDTLSAAESDDRKSFNNGLSLMAGALRIINDTMDTMWQKSKPGDYTSFRTFIFGITSQSMFPHGVIYKGVSEEPMSFRGESGANDSMVPLCDNVLQIPMPATPLTAILRDFRSYRPGNHREFLEWVQDKSNEVGVRKYAMQDRTSAALYLKIADGVREFRWRHWCFTREYILKKTRHPTATGGSPIVKWLPNQLFAVLRLQREVLEVMKDMESGLAKEQIGIQDVVERQVLMLEKEVRKFCEERGEKVDVVI